MILVIDDEPMVGAALCRLFKAAGYPTRHLQSGTEGLAAIRSHPRGTPLLVVLDEKMPEMSGTELLKTLRSDPATHNTHVICFASARAATKRREAMELGALAWLPKGGSHVPELFNEVTAASERIGGKKQTRKR